MNLGRTAIAVVAIGLTPLALTGCAQSAGLRDPPPVSVNPYPKLCSGHRTNDLRLTGARDTARLNLAVASIRVVRIPAHVASAHAWHSKVSDTAALDMDSFHRCPDGSFITNISGSRAGDAVVRISTGARQGQTPSHSWTLEAHVVVGHPN